MDDLDVADGGLLESANDVPVTVVATDDVRDLSSGTDAALATDFPELKLGTDDMFAPDEPELSPGKDAALAPDEPELRPGTGAALATDAPEAGTDIVSAILTNEVPEPTPSVELTTVAGIVTELAGSLDPMRLARVSEGRQQVALKTLLKGDRSFTNDIYTACVCYAVGGPNSIKVTDLIFSGTSEAKITFTEKLLEGEVHAAMRLSCLVGTCILVLNPVHVRGDLFQVASVKSCLKLGNLSGLGSCECGKPLLLSRDGKLCAEHAAERCSVRTSIGGTTLHIQETRTEDIGPKRAPLTKEEKLARADELKRQSIVAKKRAATLLYNRRNSLLSGGDLQLDHRQTDGKGEMDIGSEETHSESSDLASKLLSFKRKRAAIEQKDIEDKADREKRRVLEELRLEEELKVKEEKRVKDKEAQKTRDEQRALDKQNALAQIANATILESQPCQGS